MSSPIYVDVYKFQDTMCLFLTEYELSTINEALDAIAEGNIISTIPDYEIRPYKISSTYKYIVYIGKYDLNIMKELLMIYREYKHSIIDDDYDILISNVIQNGGKWCERIYNDVTSLMKDKEETFQLSSKDIHTLFINTLFRCLRYQ